MRYPDIPFEPFFIWANRPRVMYKAGVREELGFEMEKLGGKKVVLYTDKGLVGAGVAQMVIDAVKSSDLELVGVYDRILQDARIDLINEGARFYRETGADSLIAVGGGSVMDTAKAVNILIGGGHDDFQPLADQAGLWEGAQPLPPHIAFPTTAGTGSEVTYAIVVLDIKAQAKLSVSHPYCTADIAMLDPELTVKLPAGITAFTGMDALTHAIEGVTSVGAEPIADALCLHAIRLIFRYLSIAVKEPDNVNARGHMLIASNIAGMGFNSTQTGAAHALSHALGAIYGIPHGLGNGIMLPHVMAFNLEERPERFMMIADAMGLEVGGMDPVEAGRKAVEALQDFQKEIGFIKTLKDFGVPEDREALKPLVELAASDSQISYNPRYVEEEDIINLYLKAR
jgi:alcohol dehydrogenase